MKTKDLFMFSYKGLLRNKRRTLITLISLVIATLLILILISLSDGLKREVVANLKGFGSDIGIVVPTRIDNLLVTSSQRNFRAFLGALTERDAEKLKGVEGIERISYALFSTGTIVFKGETKSFSVYAVLPETYRFFSSDIEVEKGRWLRGGKEAILGSNAATAFSKDIRVGDTIEIEGTNFRVVGILKETGNSISRIDDVVFIPYKEGRALFSSQFFEDQVSGILFKVKEGYSTEEVAQRVEKELLRIKKLKEEDKFFSIITRKAMEESVLTIIRIVEAFFILISSISLIVGMVGVSNSVYMSVVERRREIGVLRAIGTLRKDVLRIFLTEGITISIISFLISLLIFFLFYLLAIYFSIPFTPNPILILSIFLIILTATLISSYFPAQKASQISPIEALREE